MKTIGFVILSTGHTAVLSALHVSATEGLGVTVLCSVLSLAAFFSWRWLVSSESEQRLAEVLVSE
jgi:hypothetical protein